MHNCWVIYFVISFSIGCVTSLPCGKDTLGFRSGLYPKISSCADFRASLPPSALSLVTDRMKSGDATETVDSARDDPTKIQTVHQRMKFQKSKVSLSNHPKSSPWNSERRRLIQMLAWGVASGWIERSPVYAYSGPYLDVNNAVAREFTAFPGLYPTIAAKLVNAAKMKPFTTKADVYAVLDSDIQRERLRQYDAAIVIITPDQSVRQFKESQICKYECKGRVSARQ